MLNFKDGMKIMQKVQKDILNHKYRNIEELRKEYLAEYNNISESELEDIITYALFYEM